MRLLLEREGHEVVAVENGLEAIERLGPASDRFDAVVTDLQMPRLGGRALYEQLQEQRPQLAERRSEEHTSELQSQSNLVCRLLLEKKKKTDWDQLFLLNSTPLTLQKSHSHLTSRGRADITVLHLS